MSLSFCTSRGAFRALADQGACSRNYSGTRSTRFIRPTPCIMRGLPVSTPCSPPERVVTYTRGTVLSYIVVSQVPSRPFS